MLQKSSENQSNKKATRGQEGKEKIEAPESVSIEPSKELSQDLNLEELESSVVAYKASFSVDEEGNAIILIVDREGGVLKQIPSEEFLNAAEALRESFGNILDVEA